MEHYVDKLHHMIATKTGAPVSHELLHDIRCTLEDYGNERMFYWKSQADFYETMYNVEIEKGLKRNANAK